MASLLGDFQRAVEALTSPFSDQGTRHAADQWLTSFKRSSEAWAVAQQALQQAPSIVALQAAQILAWKAKKQLATHPQPAGLVEVLSALLAQSAGEGAAAAPLRAALCVALANMAIQITDWVRPLETLGPRLPQDTMVEFVTVLPQECEDAGAAVQSGTAEQAFQLKQRVREWCLEVLAWLHSVHSSAMQAQLGGQQPASLEEAVLAGGAGATLPVVRCFSAWVKWGCLQYIEPQHASYFTQVAGALLHGPPSLQVAGVDVMSEVIEHASEALTPLLVDLVLRLPPMLEQAMQSGEGGRELSHVYGLFCGTHQRICVGDTQEGQALRQGLLHLLGLPRPDDPAECEEWNEAVLPAVDAAYEVLEHILRLSRGEEGEEDDTALPPRPISAAARLEFCTSVLQILLRQLQPFDAAFGVPAPGSSGAEWGGGAHPPNGAPQALRDEAEVVVDVIAEVAGGDAVVQQLQAGLGAVLQQHGARSMQAAKAVDVCFYFLRCGAGVFGAHHHRPNQPLPAWFHGMLRLYGLASEVAPCPGAQAPVTLLDYDLLTSITALAPALIPLLGSSEEGVYTGFLDLVLSRALHAVASPVRTPDVSHGSTTDATDAAADAVRAVCSFATSAGFPTCGGMLGFIEQLLQLLQQPGRAYSYQAAHQQLVVALVHAAEGIQPGSEQLLRRAAAAMQACAFAPLTAALQQLQQQDAVGSTGADWSPDKQWQQRQQAAAVGSPAWRLLSALKQVQGLLNALELYQMYDDQAQRQGLAGSPAGPMAGGQQQAVGPMLAAASVEAFLACWQWLAAACRWPLAPECFQEISLCIASCISLGPATFEPALGLLADLATGCFFMPGGAQLGQALCRAVEAYSSQPRYQQPLLEMLCSLLAAPQAQALAGLRGGDAHPEAAQALLSLTGYTLRQASSWQSAPGPAPTLAPVLSHALRLAVANAACNHRDVSQRAVALLSSLAALALEWGSSAVGRHVRDFLRQHGSCVVQGMALALLSLNSGAHLPKVVSLMGDVALLAAACALPQGPLAAHDSASPGGTSPAAEAPAVHAAASQLLRSWLAEAQTGLAASGELSQEAAAALLAQLDWEGVLRQATVQILQRQQEQGGSRMGGLGSPGGTEVRRAMQRSLRQVADAIRQAGLCT